MNTTASYGITERTAEGTACDRAVEHIRLTGYTVIDGGYGPEEVQDLSARLDRLLDAQAEKAGGFERLAAVGDEETVRCCLAYDDAFLRIATNAQINAVCARLLGKFFVLMQQNGIVNRPERLHAQTAYHRDLPYQSFVSSRPLAVSALFCVDAFTIENGATVVIPASHKVEQFPSEEVVRAVERPIEAPAGSYIVFDSMLFHRAGRNRSPLPRRAVNQVFTLPFVAQQISLPAVLEGRHADRPEVARLLGYGTGPAASVEEWWARRQRTRQGDV
jgi:ectoine hydroxylase-related dioxygenase (phytanoyl-CoA dioxygenase family)